MQEKKAAPEENPAQSVSLVLGSGGARGMAHIGIIQWLQENNYTIQSVAGSSIGAVVGGIFAAGKLEAYTEWVTALSRTDVLMLLDFSFSWAGLFKGERIIELLRELVGEYNIEDLPISFTAVATDVIARQGDLAQPRAPVRCHPGVICHPDPVYTPCVPRSQAPGRWSSQPRSHRTDPQRPDRSHHRSESEW